MKRAFAFLATLLSALLGLGCPDGGSSPPPLPPIVVDSLGDTATPPAGTVTLRSALGLAASGQPIVFDASLDGGTIDLSVVGEPHTVLRGEVMGLRNEPSGPVSYLVGYFDRDYGRSALYARKHVHIDASALSSGITLRWNGAPGNDARVLAVYGDLTLINVAITGGRSVAEDISTSDPDDQPWTLARGAGLAVWGVARLIDCRLYDNHAEGDFDRSRDRGAFGGGVYADIVAMDGCVVSGNSVLGGGAAGGGVFSVGGAGRVATTSTIDASSITGNRISGLFAYGAGVFSDGGSIGQSKHLKLTNTTIARNLVEPPPGMPPFLLAAGYWRGGGVYMSNGSTTIQSCTIVENQVHGMPRIDSLGRPNLAGGVAATIGNAHAVEHLTIGHSIIAGNTVHEIGGGSYEHDIFTGSVFYFRSMGYNRIGTVDFSQILVPVGEWTWESLSRRHYPKTGDRDGVDVAEVLNLVSGISHSGSILSVGVDAATPTVLHYEPMGGALDQVPSAPYTVDETLAEYRVDSGATDDFLEIFLRRLEDHYSLLHFTSDFTADFESFLQTVDTDPDAAGVQPYLDPGGNPILALADTGWFGPAQTWPRKLENHPYIEFWHRLDEALAGRAISGMGPEVIGDVTWAALFSAGTFSLEENSGITMWLSTAARLGVSILGVDQLGTERSASGLGDVGAVEVR